MVCISLAHGILAGRASKPCHLFNVIFNTFFVNPQSYGLFYPRTLPNIGGEILRYKISWAKVLSVFSVKGVFSWFRPVEFHSLEFAPAWSKVSIFTHLTPSAILGPLWARNLCAQIPRSEVLPLLIYPNHTFYI